MRFSYTRPIIIALSGAAALGLIIISAGANYRFGASFGKTEFDAILYGGGAASADVLKACLLLLVGWAIVLKKYGPACAGAVLWLICISFSMTSSLGFLSLNRADTATVRGLEADLVGNLQAEQHRLTEKLNWYPRHRPVSVIKGDISALQQHRRWQTTHACTDATLPESIKFCGKFARLSAEHSIAIEASKIEARLTVIQNELKSQSNRGVVSGADPQAAILSRLLNFKVQSIQDGLIILMAVLLEAGSSLGLYVVMSLSQFKRQRLEQYSEQSPEPSKPSIRVAKSPPLKLVHSAQETRTISGDKANVQSFLNLQAEPSEGSAIGATDLFRAFDQDRAAVGQPQLSQRRFGEHMAALGYTDKTRCKRTGRVQYRGLKWRSENKEMLAA